MPLSAHRGRAAMIKVWTRVCLAVLTAGCVTAQDKRPTVAAEPTVAVSESEMEAVRNKIRPCWDVSVSKTPGMVAAIDLEMGADGRPVQAWVEDKARYDRDADFRLAADSAYRAVMNPRCQPWPLPQEKYARWRRVRLVFNYDQ